MDGVNSSVDDVVTLHADLVLNAVDTWSYRVNFTITAENDTSNERVMNIINQSLINNKQ